MQRLSRKASKKWSKRNCCAPHSFKKIRRQWKKSSDRDKLVAEIVITSGLPVEPFVDSTSHGAVLNDARVSVQNFKDDVKADAVRLTRK